MLERFFSLLFSCKLNRYRQAYALLFWVPNVILQLKDNCYIERTIIDKHAHIGNNVRIVGHPDLEEVQTVAYSIRKGIVLVNKGVIIPDNTTIGLE